MPEEPDLLITGGRIWTGWPSEPDPEALGLSRGRVLALGRAADVVASLHPGYRVLDLEGGAALPAFHDAHCHPLHGGLQRRRCNLEGLRTGGECQDAVRRYAEAHPELDWLVGGGWSMESFARGTPPHELLDEVTGERPAFLVNRDGHSAWVNQAALSRAGISATTPDPAHGRIERNPDASPQGTLHESAMGIVESLVPEPDEAELAAALLEAQSHLHSLGLAGWQDASVDVAAEGAYRTVAGRGQLTARVRLALWWERERGVEQLPELVRRRERLAQDGLDGATVKVMLDGVMETFTAALLQPYLATAEEVAGDPGAGHLFLDQELARAAVVELDRLGFQVHFHAIGDRAVRVALDAVAAARRETGRHRQQGRHHIAHLQLVHPDDLPRFAELGVAANMQPFWACHEPQMDDLTLPYLGPERGAQQYPFRSLQELGALVAGGSDWPVSTADPLQEIAVAVTRVAPQVARQGASALPPFLPEQRLTLESALTAFTQRSAYLSHLEEISGTLAPGLQGDVVVLSHDPFAEDPDQLPDAGVRLTLVGGRSVYQRGGT